MAGHSVQTDQHNPYQNGELRTPAILLESLRRDDRQEYGGIVATALTSARRRSALLVGLAYAAFISLGLPDGLTGVAWPSIRGTFGLSLEALGALITTTTVGYLVSSFSSGRALARIGVGWLLIVSCLATAISLLGYGLAPLWGVMVGLGLLAGLGAGAIDAGLNTYAAENFSPRTMNWLHAAFGLGAATGPLIMSGVLGAGQSWRLGYLIVGVAQLVLASCFLITRNQWHTQAGHAQATPTAGAPMARTLKLPSAWLSILLFFLYTGLELSAGQWLYTLLTEARPAAGPGRCLGERVLGQPDRRAAAVRRGGQSDHGAEAPAPVHGRRDSRRGAALAEPRAVARLERRGTARPVPRADVSVAHVADAGAHGTGAQRQHGRLPGCGGHAGRRGPCERLWRAG